MKISLIASLIEGKSSDGGILSIGNVIDSENLISKVIKILFDSKRKTMHHIEIVCVC